ncbi:recombinase family protein [Streptomyces sp. NPDC048496]|uniref:recombinase family protein n=1 Tax=Streptomyces sp. NPDC048496 TaxID=3365558 RepID=UPI0037202277
MRKEGQARGPEALWWAVAVGRRRENRAGHPSSSALERQGLELSEAIVKGSHTVAGWVEDATVSGAVNLDQRPSLGKWLRAPLVHEWDALMVTTQDRISRDDMH